MHTVGYFLTRNLHASTHEKQKSNWIHTWHSSVPVPRPAVAPRSPRPARPVVAAAPAPAHSQRPPAGVRQSELSRVEIVNLAPVRAPEPGGWRGGEWVAGGRQGEQEEEDKGEGQDHRTAELSDLDWNHRSQRCAGCIITILYNLGHAVTTAVSSECCIEGVMQTTLR